MIKVLSLVPFLLIFAGCSDKDLNNAINSLRNTPDDLGDVVADIKAHLKLTSDEDRDFGLRYNAACRSHEEWKAEAIRVLNGNVNVSFTKSGLAARTKSSMDAFTSAANELKAMHTADFTIGGFPVADEAAILKHIQNTIDVVVKLKEIYVKIEALLGRKTHEQLHNLADELEKAPPCKRYGDIT